MRKIIVLVLIFTTVRLLISCCKGDGYNFRWSKFSLINLDHTTDQPVPLTGTVTTVNKYGMRMVFDNEMVARIPNFGFSETYAYDCVSYFENRDTITSINVITRQNFDNTHASGSSVAEYIQARVTDFIHYYPKEEYKPLQQIIPFLNRSQDKGIHNNSIDLRFQNATPNTGQHKFIVTVLFKSGRSLSDSTAIELN